MKRFILSKGLLALVFGVGLASIVVQGGVYAAIDHSRTLKTVNCTAGKIFDKSGDVVMSAQCGNKNVIVTQAMVIVSYLENPGPLTCKVHSGGLQSCEIRSLKP